MKPKTLVVVGSLLGCAFMARPASAQFVLLDNFSNDTNGASLTGDTASDSATWVGAGTAGAITTGTGVSGAYGALLSASSVEGINELPLQTVPTASTPSAITTIFFQFDLGGATPLTPAGGAGAITNVNWDLENPGSATTSGGSGGPGSGSNPSTAFEMNMNINPGGSRGGITVRNGGNFQTLSTNDSTAFIPVGNDLYDMWVVLDQNNATFSIYMSSPTDTTDFPSSTPVEMWFSGAGANTTASFPNGGTPTQTASYRNSNAVADDFVFGNGGGSNDYDEGLYNIYEDATTGSADLVNPTVVPEPGAMSLSAIALGGLVLACRRRRFSVR
ncbi:MAG: hypothetical protein ABSE62_05280 [Chthoniobacteraceae bacterium]|jgi:hypothetical protein